MSATAATPAATTERRVSLSRGPALLLGTILLAFGLYFLYRSDVFPRWGNFPNGRAPVMHHAFFGIFGINGFTGELTAIAGGLLLFGAAHHIAAKTMSLIVGVALGAAAIIAAVSGDVLGLAAANVWTEVGWGASAVILLLNVLVPPRRRVIETPVAGRRENVAYTRRIRRGRAEDEAVEPAGATSQDPAVPAAGAPREI
jgi:hypothetical protein